MKNSYQVDKDKFSELIDDLGGVSKANQKTGVSKSILYNVRCGRLEYISEETVDKFEQANISRDKFIKKDLANNLVSRCMNKMPQGERNSSTPAFLEESEILITGLKRNIENRLLITHSKAFVRDIMYTIDELIKESSFFGLECQKNNMEHIVLGAMKRRLTNDSLSR